MNMKNSIFEIKKGKITLSSKIRVGFVMLIVLLVQIFMPLKVSATDNYKVLMWHPDGASGVTLASDTIKNHYKNDPSITVTSDDKTGGWLIDDNITGVNLIYLIDFTNGPTSSLGKPILNENSINTLKKYLNAGGRLVLVGSVNANQTTGSGNGIAYLGNTLYNQLASILGADFEITDDDFFNDGNKFNATINTTNKQELLDGIDSKYFRFSGFANIQSSNHSNDWVVKDPNGNIVILDVPVGNGYVTVITNTSFIVNERPYIYDDHSYDTPENPISYINITSQRFIKNLLVSSANNMERIASTPSYTVNNNLIFNGEEQVGVTYNNVTVTAGTDKATNAGQYTVTLTPNEGYTWEDGTTDAKEVSWSISPISITDDMIKFEDREVTYDGEEHSIEIIGSLPGGTILYSTDGVNYSETLPTFKNAGEYIIYYRASKANYNDITGNKTLTINKKSTTVTIDDKEKTYGDNDAKLTYTAEGLIANDTLQGIALSREAGENVGTYAITGTTDASKDKNYNIAFVNGTYTVTKRAITVKANDKTISYGDATPTFDYSITNGSLATGDSLSNINFSELTQTDVGEYTIEISQTTGSNSNYDITFENGKFTINKKAITPEVTLSQDEFTYNKSEQRPTVFVKLDGVDLSASEYNMEFSADNTNAGNKSVKVISKNINYTFDEIKMSYVINAKPIDSSMVAIEDSQYEFDDTNKTPTVTLTYGNYTLIENTDYEILNTSTTTAKDYGNYSIIVKGKGNYIGEYSIPWSITKKQINGVTVNGINTIYDGTNKEIDVTIPSGATITYKTNAQGEYTLTKPTFKNAGEYTVYYKIELDDNYEVIEGSVPVKITPKSVIVTIHNKEKTFGENDSELTFTASGLIENETLQGITLSREKGEDVGTYAITGERDITEDKNYNITFENGTYTINKKVMREITIIIKNQIYIGEEITPTVIVKDGDRIIPSTEYELEFEDNIGPGTGTVVIKNKEGGNYTIETKSATFNIIVPGKVKFIDPITPNSNKANVVDSSEEIISKIDLTDEDLDIINQGKNIDIYLEVKDISDSISSRDKKAIEEKLGNNKTGLYLDINLFKKVEGEDPTKITKIKVPITISFEIPDNLINNDSSVNRIYKILRLHDGVVDELDVKVNGKKATFETDSFSTYSLTYKDIDASSNSNTGNSNIDASNNSNSGNSDITSASSPKTGDNIGTSFVMFIISGLGLISALGYTVISNKRKLVKTNN